MNIIQVPSPNFGYSDQPDNGRLGWKPYAIVMHVAQGSLSACDNWFQNPTSEASVHFCVGKNGIIHQYVSLSNAAWANGVVKNSTWKLINSANPNLYTISIEHEGFTGEEWTEEMYNADVELISSLCKTYEISIDDQHIIGHCEIDGIDRKNCPGTGLNFDELFRRLRGKELINPFKRGLIMHLGPNGEYPLGRIEHWDGWVKEIKEMGFDGVKVVVFDTANSIDKDAIKAIKKLVDAGLVVVARLYRNKPNPGILTENHMQVVKLLVSIGVTLFEVNNEPNLHVEWANQIPSNGPEVVAANWLIDAKRVIDAGGYPAFPACSPGGNWDDGDFIEKFMSAIKRFGVSDITLRKSWIAVHNYSHNKPIEYPNDPINVKEKGVVDIMKPGESNGFRKAEMLGGLSKKYFGFYMPVISTEGGPVMDKGFSGDPRYPVMMDEVSHANVAVEQAQWMMNDRMPSYFWATCMWVMCNKLMENPVDAGFEGHAWYPFWKATGLMAVSAFKNMPKHDRVKQEPVTDVGLAIVDAVKKKVEFGTYPWLLKQAILSGECKERVTDEFKTTIGGVVYLVQAFGKTAFYCPDGQYSVELTKSIQWI